MTAAGLLRAGVTAATAGLWILSCTRTAVLRRPQLVPLGVKEPFAADSVPHGELIALGRDLFFDERLSRDGSLSCASCHDPAFAFTEPHAVSHGIGHGARRRNTPTVLNAAFETSYGWDGRFATLEAQLFGVFAEVGDMGMGISDAAAIVRSDTSYRRRFVLAVGREPDVAAFTKALADYQRSLLSGNSRVDRMLIGGDSSGLSEAERRGWNTFMSRGCAGCHNPFTPAQLRSDGSAVSLMTDRRLHNLGVGYASGRMADAGQYEVTGRPSHFGRFKTPSLRNVALTAPYMHDGSIKTLEEVIEFYAQGGIANPNLDDVISFRVFTPQEKADLVAILRAMTSDPVIPAGALPPVVRGGPSSHAAAGRSSDPSNGRQVVVPGSARKP